MWGLFSQVGSKSFYLISAANLVWKKACVIKPDTLAEFPFAILEKDRLG
jgi:hypothetical protein